METKQEMLSALRKEFEGWEQLLGRLREDEIVARDMPSGLSIKDVVAHLMAWQRLSSARLRAAMENAEPTYELGPASLDPDAEENLERINVWIHETYVDEPWPAVYKLWKDGFQAFLDLGRAIPDDVLLQPARFAWLGGLPLSGVLLGSYEHHHEEHYQPLVEWLRLHRNRG